ncbi:GATA zinc finger domain-containing protein 14 isoform X2 [Bradysia coprophila]|uniref:GATA zinc finger domain-containing protein 14 isoform X2 n=1 Tax=Bradysia coprophila TaxID=38358 RepID=UPI00187D928E|nr:GATA zinc finger domain-containing protein 14 isoform X2 [Bradysia coprophila]
MSSTSKQSTGTVPKANKSEKKMDKSSERPSNAGQHINGFAGDNSDRESDQPPKSENIENQNSDNITCCMGSNETTLDEQLKLERKLYDLYSKKEQMASLVDELQLMNEVAQRSLNRNSAPVRNVPIEYEQIVPIELIPGSKSSSPSNPNFRMSPVIPKPVAEIHDYESSRDDNESTIGGNEDSLTDKIAEINTMKNQLQRLKNLMNTVKIIEIKNGDCEENENDNVSVESSPTHANYNESHYENVLSTKRDSVPSTITGPEVEEEPDMDERVRLLQSMTQDLKLQAMSIAEERDRLRDIKNEMGRRRENEGLKKITNLNQTRFDDKSNDQCLGSDGDKTAEPTATYKDNSWNTSQFGLANGSARSNFERQNEQFAKTTQLPPVVPTKINSNAGASADVRSINSNSSRGISLPPPMRHIGPEERPSWMKSAHDTLRMSSVNQQNLDNTQDWQHSNNFCNFGPQSPQFHCHHSVNSDQNYNCRPMYYPSLSSNQSGIGNDHALLQQFIQTQQMLINSVCQFNQLLWDQQREINNLNTAVLLLQERMFNSSRNGFPEPLNSTRAETVPPNLTYNNSYPCHARAQSEQPVNQTNCISNCLPHSPYGQQYQCQSHPVPIQVESPNNIRSRRFNNNIIHHNQIDSSSCCYPTHLLNNDLHTSISNSSNYQTNSSQSYMQQQNNNLAANNITNSNNQLRQQNIAASTTSPALNNQTTPGNRANNYWDNFRSYSRQNLLSSNSCKSNEEASSINNLPQNRDRDQSHLNQSSRLPTHMTHNNLPLVANNKYSIHFQNQTNQQQQQQNTSTFVGQMGTNGSAIRNPEELNINQSMNQQLLHQSNDTLGHDHISSLNNLNMNFGPFHSNDVASNFMNSINLELNELKPNTSKMVPKRSTGGHKRKSQSSHPAEQNNLLVIQQETNGIDSNLTKTVMTNDSKSSEKSFEALKENVYQELISTSDPLRNRLMQTFHDLYNRYETNPHADNSAILNQCSAKTNETAPTFFNLHHKRKNNLSSTDVCGDTSCDGDEDLAEADQNCNAEDMYVDDFDADGATGFDNSSSDMVILPSSPTSNSDESPTAVPDDLT